MKKLNYIVLPFIFLWGFFFKYFPETIYAAPLSDLPFGAVIQIQGTDTGMCDDQNCTTITAPVLPYKFVKMQARDDQGRPVVSENTYWALLDNYCWWASSDCRFYDGARKSRYASWNANHQTDYNNNLSVPHTYNIMNTMRNFYASLPATIGTLDKATAVPDYAWEMRLVSSVSGNGTPIKSGCASNWIANVNSLDGMTVTFSDSNDCTMTTKIGMLSYDEWQGGLSSAGYGAFPIAAGSGYSYCQARYGKDCTNDGLYGLFTDDSTFSGYPIASASNPRPRYPWFRSPQASSTNVVWVVSSSMSGYSLSWNYTYDMLGVLPTLWFSSDLSTDDNLGSGTYSSPYLLTNIDCTLPENTHKLTCLPMGSVIQIQGTDTVMLDCAPNTANCTATTSQVLPYKFVKMQARDDQGNPVQSLNTYWALLDNYCWWGSAKCHYFDGSIRPNYSSWNANSDAAGEFTNNLSDPKTYNIMTTMGNFYASLPETIGGLNKTAAIPDYAWEMRPVSIAANAPTKAACTDNWTAITRDFSDMLATFSDAAACTMTTKIGMLSYDEWQGGLAGYGVYPTLAGSGYSYCQARYGKDCTNVGSYGLFSDASSLFGLPVASALNPRPRYPWFRSSQALGVNNVWVVNGDVSMISVGWNYTGGDNGVLPALWLSSSLIFNPQTGMGTYAAPYQIATQPTLTISNLTQNQSAYPNTIVSITGIVSDPDLGETLTVEAEIGGTIKSETFSNSPFSNQGFTLTWKGEEMVEGVYGVSTDPDHPSTSSIIISLTDGTNEVTTEYQGRIISRPTPEQTVSNDEIKNLYNDVYTKEAGALFFLAGTKPNLKDRTSGDFTFTNPQANDFYCYSDTNCFNLLLDGSMQLWYKEIAGKEYPFAVQFYEQPLAESELRINDTNF